MNNGTTIPTAVQAAIDHYEAVKAETDADVKAAYRVLNLVREQADAKMKEAREAMFLAYHDNV